MLRGLYFFYFVVTAVRIYTYNSYVLYHDDMNPPISVISSDGPHSGWRDRQGRPPSRPFVLEVLFGEWLGVPPFTWPFGGPFVPLADPLAGLPVPASAI